MGHRLGIDIGSKTIKLALVDDDTDELVYSEYRRHRSQIKQALRDALHRCLWVYGDCSVQVTATGSAGMRLSDIFDIPFVQEVVALRRAVERYLPDIDVILEMGGEDTKLVYLTGCPEQRMNTVCAGGTGGFIDMMASIMGVHSSDMHRLAMGYATLYPIASRCAVFARSDVRPLLAAGAKKEDIAASVLMAVATQAVAGLSAGRPISGRVALLGGPFQNIPFLRMAFCKVAGIEHKDTVVPKDAHLFVARGAAISAQKSEALYLSDLERLVEEVDFANSTELTRLPPLFADKATYEEFRRRHSACKIPKGASSGIDGDLFLGIDAGSTTLKMALINEAGELLAYQYNWNEGDLLKSFPRLLKEISRSYERAFGDKRVLRRSLVVGYGEEFCKAAFMVDAGEVETVAHLRAALEIDPQVDFLLDIGGQDVKCIYVKDGLIDDIVLNEACSSGCGSLFDQIARSMHTWKEPFAAEALYADAPVDLGTRCSTFMESRVKHAQKEGATPGDIAAGVCYATARNALFKVVRKPDFSQVGEHVVVQGGAFANDALLRAFELECGREVMRPDRSEIMGAWGAALLARDEWLSLRQRDPEKAARAKSSLLPSDELAFLTVSTEQKRCSFCGNSCMLLVTSFADTQGGKARCLVSGNRCERGALAVREGRQKASRPPNMREVKNALIASFDAKGASGGDIRIGIPKTLSLYESYPFWKTLFDELGYPVVSSPCSGEDVYRKGMGAIPAEGACYPFKLAFGLTADAIERKATHLFVPFMRQNLAREGLLGLSFDAGGPECPLIERLPALLADNATDTPIEDAVFLMPDLRSAQCTDDIADELFSVLFEGGLVEDKSEFSRAFCRAQDAYGAFFERLERANKRVLERIDDGEFPGALLAGHPYHADPGISHGIDGLLCELGYAVLDRIDYNFSAHSPKLDADAGLCPWFANAELAHAIEASESHPNLQIVIERSFGCGIDALFADAAHERLRSGVWPVQFNSRHLFAEKKREDAHLLDSSGPSAEQALSAQSASVEATQLVKRPFAELKIDQIVDLAAVRIRIRSLAYATGAKASCEDALAQDGAWTFMDDDEYSQVIKAEQRRKERQCRAMDRSDCSS